MGLDFWKLFGNVYCLEIKTERCYMDFLREWKNNVSSSAGLPHPGFEY